MTGRDLDDHFVGCFVVKWSVDFKCYQVTTQVITEGDPIYALGIPTLQMCGRYSKGGYNLSNDWDGILFLL